MSAFYSTHTNLASSNQIRIRRNHVRSSYARDSLVGIVLFGLFLGLFVVIFNTDYDLLALRIQAFLDPQGFASQQRIPGDWLKRYNIVAISEDDFLSDQDHDGLTLEQEYIHLTNPLNPDTDGDGVSDGDEVANDQNPLGVGVVDVDHDGISDVWEVKNNLDSASNDRDTDNDNDKLSNWEEFIYKTDPQNPDTDGDGYSDGVEVLNGYDPTAPGDVQPQVTITLSKIGVTVPMVWSHSILEEQLQKDLTKGAIHYPRTAAPGQRGNMFIAAHSSNYAWVEGNFNDAFSKLNQIQPGDVVTVNVVYQNGAKMDYVYKVTQQKVVQPDDPWIFLQTNEPTLTLSTCWPLGTRQKRLIVKAKLVPEI